MLRFDVDDEFELEVLGCGRVDADINVESMANDGGLNRRKISAEQMERSGWTVDETLQETSSDMSQPVEKFGVTV